MNNIVGPHGLRYMDLDEWKALAASKSAPDDVLLRKATAQSPEVVKIVEAERRILITISTASVDRDRDTINQEGWITTYYEQNPVVLWAHQYNGLPLGTGELVKTPERLMAWDTFHDRDLYPFADTVYRMMTLPVPSLRMASVGYRAETYQMNEDRRGVDFQTQELYEHSIVPIGSNRDALAAAKSALGSDIMKPVIEWCEQVLDTWHGEKGLWLPKSQVEEAFKALSTKTTVDMGKKKAQPDEPENTITEKASEEPEVPLEDEEVEIDVLTLLSLSESGDTNHNNEEPPDFFGLGADQLRGLVREVAGESLSDALKAEITATTGRLID